MSAGAQAALLPDGKRLHLHHGPIDLICGVEGADREACFAQAAARFATILDELVPILPLLRSDVNAVRSGPGASPRPRVGVKPPPMGAVGGWSASPTRAIRLQATSFRLEDFSSSPVARRMFTAAQPHAAVFVTPMAAVAGAVADEVLHAMIAGQGTDKAYVNNGGDIAFHLSGAATFSALGPAGEIRFAADEAARGVATSGWRGRSYSLGIADAVTVVARNAAQADVAATLIANAVDLPGHPAVQRVPATDLSPDSDLGARLVTVEVGDLSPEDVRRALAAGGRAAEAMRANGHILQAVLSLQGQVVVIEEREAVDA